LVSEPDEMDFEFILITFPREVSPDDVVRFSLNTSGNLLVDVRPHDSTSIYISPNLLK